MRVDKKKLCTIAAMYFAFFYLILLVAYLVCEVYLGAFIIAFPILMFLTLAGVTYFIWKKFYKIYDAGVKLEIHKESMFKRIANELSTPLNSIEECTDIYELEENQEEKDQSVISIKKEVIDLKKIIEDILGLEEIEKGEYQLASESFSVNAVFDSILDKYWDIIEDKKIELNFTAVKETKITADKERMTQIIENFIYNGIINMPKGKKIIVAMDKRGFVMLVEGLVCTESQLKNMWSLEAYNNTTNLNEKRSSIKMYISKKLLEKQGFECGAMCTKTGVQYYIKFTK